MTDPEVEINDLLCQLKTERDTWQALANEYKAAFETQTNRILQLQDICFAAQAELENERARSSQRISTEGSSNTRKDTPMATRSAQKHELFEYGTAHGQDNHGVPGNSYNALFAEAQRCSEQRDYSGALLEVDRLLRGPLSPKARTEGLLMKSEILAANGPEDLYDALAACSEALELCDRIDELESFLPRVQFQRGIIYYELRMIEQAREAFNAIGKDEVIHTSAKDYRQSCDEELEFFQGHERRKAFDENRGFNWGAVMQLDDRTEVRVPTANSFYTDKLPASSTYVCIFSTSRGDKIKTHLTTSPPFAFER